ncbi:MAG: ABC transporter ATP-binding protein [Chthoniobacterales bacterium]
MSDVVIRAENVGKKYQLGRGRDARYRTLRDTLSEGARNLIRGNGASSPADDFWALSDVSFAITQGEVVGIIGRNGAGKSTLLKILSRITEPTTGKVRIKGRVASLLEVGTGFHPELTGRENIFLNGAILGMTRLEIKAKFDEIVAFAEVEKFLDTPVKRYSSGMYVRLAFAVAAHLEPEILVIDEVLAVGDAEFQKKCLGKMSEAARVGRTVLFVSHQMNAVQTLCGRCLLFVSGRIAASGSPTEVISRYLEREKGQSQWTAQNAEHDNPHFRPTRLAVVDSDLQPLARDARADEVLGVLIEGEVRSFDSALVVGFALYQSGGPLLFWSLQTDTSPDSWPELKKGRNFLISWLPSHFLNEGSYTIEIIVSLHHRVWYCEPGVSAPLVSFSIRGGLSESPHWMAPRPGLLAPVLGFEIAAIEEAIS